MGRFKGWVVVMVVTNEDEIGHGVSGMGMIRAGKNGNENEIGMG